LVEILQHNNIKMTNAVLNAFILPVRMLLFLHFAISYTVAQE